MWHVHSLTYTLSTALVVIQMLILMITVSLHVCLAAGQVFQNTPCTVLKIYIFLISVTNIKSLLILLDTSLFPPLCEFLRAPHPVYNWYFTTKCLNDCF